MRSTALVPGQLSLGLVRDTHAILELLAHEALRSESDATLVPEFVVRFGAARIDLAVIGSKLEGYEIKSVRDDLRRLRAQAEIFGSVFDRMTLVMDRIHYRKAKRVLPKWWGMMLVTEGSSSIDVARECATNPALDPMSLAQLLWRSELVDSLGATASDQPGLPTSHLRARLVESLSASELQALVCTRIRRRRATTVGGPHA